jgi:predicted metal-binding protein
MPIRCVARCERPFDILRYQAGKNVWIFSNIDVVIIADKFVIMDGPIYDKSDYSQKDT